ncbi:unnamed protein product [Linum tenue]|uniref:AT1G17665-like protein n=1 Tax=Linum tenue TaxID=586396 RepID=A0AAV0I486_9ROSI|nr:unnamed protein product [Linum tenue]
MAALAIAFASSYLSHLIPAAPVSQYFSFFSSTTHKTQPMLLSHLLAFFFFSFAFSLSFSFSLFFLCRSLRRHRREEEPLLLRNPVVKAESLSKLILTRENENGHLPHSLLLEILPSDSPKWAALFSGDPDGAVSGPGDGSSAGGESLKLIKKKKKRARKKRLDSKVVDENAGGGCKEEKDLDGPGLDSGSFSVKPELVCLYPFTSASSATQRKIKQQYDQLVKCNEKRGLTLAQVAEFANCLVEARTELQHKSEVIKRRFTITKALLFKADRSSIDRLRQQIYKLEVEQKRLEEDAFVYNWLQQQLKLSPAYKKAEEWEVANTDELLRDGIAMVRVISKLDARSTTRNHGFPSPPGGLLLVSTRC